MQDLEGDSLPAGWDGYRNEPYSLCLFVTGTSPVSTRAISNLKKICDEHLAGRYELEIIDVYQQPLLVKKENVTAVPMLIKKLPLPLKRIVGDLSDTEKVLKALGLT